MTAIATIDATIGEGSFARHVALEIPATGVTVLRARSGAGKSLTLETLAGLRRVRAGRIALAGRVVDDSANRDAFVRPQDRRIGMVFQDGRLLPHRSVLDNVSLAAAGGRRGARRATALTLLQRVGAAELGDRRPGALSGGQQQRACLARALARQPQLLLLDEPFTALDPPVRRQLGELLREVSAAQRVPALLVTHDAEEAARVGDRILTLPD